MRLAVASGANKQAFSINNNNSQSQQMRFSAFRLTSPATSEWHSYQSHSSTIAAKLVAPSKFHRAAIDGYVDMLCDASKRDANAPSEPHGYTPTQLAALNGHLEALRILVGRGGDPEKAAADGSSALHLAASRNHLNCVSFLVNFGANMWALDNELHTAKDVAAIEQKTEVLDYLDQMMAKQSALSTRNVQKAKEKAKQAAEKRLKRARKCQLKAIKQVERDERYLMKLDKQRRVLKSAHSISDIKLVGRFNTPSFDTTTTSSSLYESSGCGSSIGGTSSHRPVSSVSSFKTSCTTEPTSTASSARSAGLARLLNDKLRLDAAQQQRRQRLPICRQHTADTASEASSGGASSVSSASGYLSCAHAAAPLRAGASGCSTATRPKYSDLVAVTSGGSVASSSSSSTSSASSETSSSGAASDSFLQWRQNAMSNSSNNNNNNKRSGVGVSRKLHLRQLLALGQPTSASPPPTQRLKQQQQQQHFGGRRLTRALSEPNLSDAAASSEPDSEEEEECEEKTRQGEQQQQQEPQKEQKSQTDKDKAPNRAPIAAPPPPPACTATQARMHHIDHANELLQHQLNAGPLPLRPSIIRQQKQQQQQLLSNQQRSTTLLNNNAADKPTAATATTAAQQSSQAPSVDTIEQFLAANGLAELSKVFANEHIDLEALVLLSEDDLKSLNILLGPRRKLLKAIGDRSKQQQAPPDTQQVWL